jgi:hypothetical protein
MRGRRIEARKRLKDALFRERMSAVHKPFILYTCTLESASGVLSSSGFAHLAANLQKPSRGSTEAVMLYAAKYSINPSYLRLSVLSTGLTSPDSYRPVQHPLLLHLQIDHESHGFRSCSPRRATPRFARITRHSHLVLTQRSPGCSFAGANRTSAMLTYSHRAQAISRKLTERNG